MVARHLSDAEQSAVRQAMAHATAAFKAKTGRGSASAIATAIQANEQTVKAYLRGQRRPPVGFVRSFAAVANVSASELFVQLGWLSAQEVAPPDAHALAEHVASAAAMLGRLEPQIRSVLDRTSASSPAVFASATAMLADVDGASRFDARLSRLSPAIATGTSPTPPWSSRCDPVVSHWTGPRWTRCCVASVWDSDRSPSG